MDLFTIMGKIAIDCADAEAKMDALIEKANTLNGALGGTKTVGTGSSSGTGSTGSAASTGGTTSQTGQNANGLTVTTGTTAKGYILGNLGWKALTFLGETAKDVVEEGFSYNKDKEAYVATLKTMMGVSREEAEAFFSDITELSKETPLNMGSLGTGATRLINLGYKPEEILDTLYMLGDVSRGDNATFERTVKFVSDVLGKGRLQAQERNQATEAGIPLYQLLSKYYGLTGTNEENNAELYAMQEEGEITAQDVMDALWQSTKPGGQYNNAMSNAMETYSGAEERLKELASIVSGKASNSLFDLVKNKLIPKTTELLETTNGILDGKGAADQLYGDGKGGYDIDAVTGASMNQSVFKDGISAPSWLKDVVDKLTIPATPEGWTPASSVQNTEPIADAVKGAIEETMPDAIKNAIVESMPPAIEGAITKSILSSIPGAVASGMSGVTITTGDVRLDTGAIVGQLRPAVNAAANVALVGALASALRGNS